MSVSLRQTTDSGHSENRVSESERDGESELNEEVGTLESDPGLAERNIFSIFLQVLVFLNAGFSVL